MQECGFIEIIPLICTLTMQGQYATFLHPDSLQGTQLGVAALAAGLMAATSFGTQKKRKGSKSLWMVTAAKKLKDAYSLEEKL